MQLIKWMQQLLMSRAFQYSFIGGLVAIMVYDHVLTPGVRLLPHMPVVLYNVLVTALAVMLLLAIAVALWISAKASWDHLTKKDLRRTLWARFRQWPNSKWHLAIVFAAAWLLAVTTVLVSLSSAVPDGYLAGVVSPEQAQAIGITMTGPPLAIGFMLILRGNVMMYRDFRQRLACGTPKEKVVLCASMSFVLIAVLATAVGEVAGWSHMLWFNNA